MMQQRRRRQVAPARVAGGARSAARSAKQAHLRPAARRALARRRPRVDALDARLGTPRQRGRKSATAPRERPPPRPAATARSRPRGALAPSAPLARPAAEPSRAASGALTSPSPPPRDSSCVSERPLRRAQRRDRARPVGRRRALLATVRGRAAATAAAAIVLATRLRARARVRPAFRRCTSAVVRATAGARRRRAGRRGKRGDDPRARRTSSHVDAPAVAIVRRAPELGR